MTLTWFDHLALLSLAVLFPLADSRYIRRSEEAVASGEEDARSRLYRYLLVGTWSQVVVVLGYWILRQRPLADLGLTFEVPPGAAWGLLVALLCCLYALGQWVASRRSPRFRRAAREQVGTTERLLTPQTPREVRWFDGAAWTAGIGEEVLYRGYVIAYLQLLLGVSFGIAAGLSALIFGAAHLYQGLGGIVKTGVIGAILAAVYGLTGSLWVPIAMHVVWDLAMGRLVQTVLRGDELEPAPTSDC